MDEPELRDGMDWLAWYMSNTSCDMNKALDELMRRRLVIQCQVKE